MSDAYQLAPLFVIRMAGAPFDVVERLGTPDSIVLAHSAATEAERTAALARELDAARASLYRDAATLLPGLLLFGSGPVRELLKYINRVADSGEVPTRNARAGDRERHMLLYLQRVCAKNDTFSEFGPTAWGTIANDAAHVELLVRPIASRESYFEYWAAHAIAAAINADVETPRKVAVPALEPHAFDVLLDDVFEWPESEARSRWLTSLQPLAQLPQQLVAATAPAQRCVIMDEARERLRQLGAARTTTQRALYAATNPIAEECARDCRFVLPRKMADELTREAEPWIDLWRDCYALIAHRVSTALRRLLPGNAPTPLPEFLARAEAINLPLTSIGMVAPAAMAFAEIKAAFRANIADRANNPELQLTLDDCHFVRRNFDYPKFDEYTYPSADLQISARSLDALNSGEYEWLISEFHPPVALLHHCFWWSCHDHAALADALRSTVLGMPSFHYGFFAADFTAHTTVRAFEALPDLTNFVAPQRANPSWRRIEPASAEVFADEATGDVRVRMKDSGEVLGSFARSWIIPLGFHPFNFGGLPHTPRLRCGKVIVQRRSWIVTLAEFGTAKFAGISAELVGATERLRAARDLPRYVYIRPSETALRRSGAEGRDKDTKPVFVDLESYLFVEIFYRWLAKAGELEITEMLPDPDHLLWREGDGRRTFELRTLIVPR